MNVTNARDATDAGDTRDTRDTGDARGVRDRQLSLGSWSLHCTLAWSNPINPNRHISLRWPESHGDLL